MNTNNKNIIDIGKINFTLELLNKGKKNVLVPELPNPCYEYKDGKKTERIIAMEYPVLLSGLGFARIYIKVPNEQFSSIPAEKFLSADGPIPCIVDGFSGRLYKTVDGNVAISATATAIKLA